MSIDKEMRKNAISYIYEDEFACRDPELFLRILNECEFEWEGFQNGRVVWVELGMCSNIHESSSYFYKESAQAIATGVIEIMRKVRNSDLYDRIGDIIKENGYFE